VFLVEGHTVARVSRRPYEAVWKATAGEHRMQARVRDTLGNEDESNLVAITIRFAE